MTVSSAMAAWPALASVAANALNSVVISSEVKEELGLFVADCGFFLVDAAFLSMV